MRLALLLVGFGHVGRRFVHLLDEQRATLEAAGVKTASKSTVVKLEHLT